MKGYKRCDCRYNSNDAEEHCLVATANGIKGSNAQKPQWMIPVGMRYPIEGREAMEDEVFCWQEVVIKIIGHKVEISIRGNGNVIEDP
jgi:hypothetical protein